MWNKIRIISWVCVLIGGSFYFYVWSQRQIDDIFAVNMNNISSYTPISNIVKQDVERFIVSTSTDIVVLRDKDFASSSDLLIFNKDRDYNNSNFSFPTKDKVLYAGCTYELVLDLNDYNDLKYLGIQLFDYGNKKTISSINSGLNFSKTISQNKFKWSIADSLWPGEYYLYIPFIDGVNTDIKSYRFKVENNIGYCD